MPLDRGIIDQQLQALGESTAWWEVREMRDLPAVLRADERILAMARANVARIRVIRRKWLIVLTNTRLLCLKSQRRSWQQFDVDLDHIMRVSLRVGPFRGRVRVATESQMLRLLMPRPDAFRFQSALLSVVTPVEQIRGFGPTRVARRVLDHMMALPAAAFSPEHRPALPPAPKPMVQDHTAVEYVNQLEKEIDQLRQHVEFLEQLLNESSRNKHETRQHGSA